MRISDWSSDVCSSDLEEGARDLVGRQAAEQAQGQCDAAFARKYRMAGGEHQTQQVVADVVVEPVVESGRGHVLLLLQFARYFRVLAPLQLAAAQAVDRATLGGGHPRSEERRVGKACVSTCRSRWSPVH